MQLLVTPAPAIGYDGGRLVSYRGSPPTWSAMPTPGYSGTPLARKLGIGEACRLVVTGAPEDYLALLDPLPRDVVFDAVVTADTDIVHVFAVHRGGLAEDLNVLRTRIRSNAAIWVSWPKKASRMPTDITEDVIRELALPLGLVDVKVCAVSTIWSGLKLVIRKELR